VLPFGKGIPSMNRKLLLVIVLALCAVPLFVTSLAWGETAIGVKASAYSAASGHPASYMNDGSLTTAWIASSTAVPQKVTLDLGSSKAVGTSTVNWAVSGGIGYRVFGSNDLEAWTELVNADTNMSKTTQNTLWGTWRYIRMRIGWLQWGRAGVYEWSVTTGASLQTPTPAVSPTPTVIPSPTVTPSTAVTPTSTPTVTPTITPTITPTVTPTVSPTAPGSPSVPAGYTLVQNQTINNLVTNGLTNRYYYKCTFTGGGPATAVLSFTGITSNVIFDSCTIATGGGWNGVSINDAYGQIHDVTFKSCLFKAQTRMGFECTSRPTTAATQYQRIDITGSTFEPMGNEAVSYDGGAAAGNCTFSGNTIQGAGNLPSQEWGNGFEINGPSNFTVTNNTIWQCRNFAFNFQRHTTAACGWVVSNNVLDASHHAQSTAQSPTAQQVLALDVYGGTFAGNTVVSAAPGGSVAYLSGSHDMNWKTTTWRDASGRSGYATPTQVNCSGNAF
jgi:hypothetical protein